MKNGKLTQAECEHVIVVLRRVIADERESQSLREAARDELIRLERLREMAVKENVGAK